MLTSPCVYVLLYVCISKFFPWVITLIATYHNAFNGNPNYSKFVFGCKTNLREQSYSKRVAEGGLGAKLYS